MVSPALEALVGHLFIVDGRLINSPSPGAITMVAPRKAARGRDDDTFLGLLTLSDDQRQPASFYENIIKQIADSYYQTGGSVTSALRQAISEVNASILKQNNKLETPIRIGLACVIFRETDLYIALVGTSRCLLIAEGQVERLPADDETFQPIPLGSEHDPDVRYYSRQVAENDFLLLADQSLNRLKDTTLLYAFESGEVDTAMGNLRSVVDTSATAIVSQFVRPLVEDAILPPAEPQAAVEAASLEAPSPPQKKLPFFQRASRDTAKGLAKATENTQLVVEKMLPEEEIDNPLAERFQLSTGIQILVAVSVAILVALLTSFVYQERGQKTQYAQLIRAAQEEVELARSSGDQAEARPHWENALSLFDQAAIIRAPGAEISAMEDETLAALDAYDRVTRVSPILLRTYPAGSVLHSPIVNGLNLYVIDTTNDILYREDLSEEGTSFVNQDSQIITRQGEDLGGLVVSGLIDSVWIEDGGVPQRNVLGILSRNGLLLTYSPSWDVSVSLLPGHQAWGDPRAIALYDRDLYILDTVANEIWRYEADADSYSAPPQRYFTDFEPQLGDAIDMTIDSNGKVYVLHASGQITKYFSGKQDIFQFEGLPQPVTRPTALYLSQSLFDPAFFITDAGSGRIYTTALTGTFLTNYKDGDNNIFNAVSGAYYNDLPPYVYITTGNQIYYFSRP